MVILHDAKYNSEWGFYAFLKIEQRPVSFQNKTQKTELKKQGVVFLKNVFTHWSHGLEQVTALPVWLGARRTLRA